MTEVKNKSMSFTAHASTLEACWDWAKELSDRYGLPVNNFSAYKYSQKFNSKTQKYEEQKPYYSCTVSLTNDKFEEVDVNDI